MEKKTIKVLLIVSIVLLAITLGALIGGLCSLTTTQDNVKTFFVITGISGGLTIISIAILVATYFKFKKK
ncbi:MAG: hypothetical protein J5666_06830 [Bacilli bacterium]|nr:hypothetical protein [Bacilli bacterium]